ncbi:MAG TPA: hypothetical protein VMV94_12905 [Phycisphaerae bacterium]|nr:hypothetical protein [Phycisphaerae bacterium]
MNAAIAETKYLLDRWRLAVSARGVLHVRPTGPVLSPEELAGLFALLYGACDATFPMVLLLDLSETMVTGGQWSTLASLITGFAQKVDLRCRMISGPERPIAGACLFRHDHV